MTPKERAAMQQALVYFEAIANGETVKPYEVEDTITALREALDNSLKPKCFADYQPNHAIDRVCASCAVAAECQTGEQAEQEPVALVFVNRHGDVEITDYTLWQLKRGHYKIYAAPLAKQDTHATHVVRTKDHCNPLQDLTDDEILDVALSIEIEFSKDTDKFVQQLEDIEVFARAIIEKFKEKNQ